MEAVRLAEFLADLTATAFFLAAADDDSCSPVAEVTVRGLCVLEPAVLLLGVVAPPETVVVLRRPPPRVRCCGL